MRLKRAAFSSALASAALALALTGCGSQPGADDDAEGADTATPAPTVTVTEEASPTATGATGSATSTASESPTSTTSASPTDSSTSGSATSPAGEATQGGALDAALNAIDTAEGEVGGQAVSIDFDDGGWDVTVVQDGQETEVKLGADGGTVREQDDSESVDSDDQQELDAAEITLGDALTRATDAHPGNIDDAELNTDRGTVVYDVELYVGPDNSGFTVYIDAANGEVVRTS